MASLTINFQANTSGDHYVGYREIHMDAPNTYTVITVPVITPGMHNAVINIDGSLYCGPLHMAGYIIAACEDQTDINGDGIPDAAIVWTQDLNEQLDPCVLTNFECNNTGVKTVTIPNGGTGYVINDVLPFVETTLGDEILPGFITVTGTSGLGEILSFDITDPGSWLALPTINAAVAGNADANLTPTELEECEINDLTDVACLTVQGLKKNWTGAIGESIDLCADFNTVALQALVGPEIVVVAAGNCKCLPCEELSIDASASTTGNAVVQYNRCWDRDSGETLVIVVVASGDIFTDIDCVIPATVLVRDNSLDNGLTLSYDPCTAP